MISARLILLTLACASLTGCGLGSTSAFKQASTPARGEILTVHEAINGRERSSAAWSEEAWSADEAGARGGLSHAAAVAPRGLHAALAGGAHAHAALSPTGSASETHMGSSVLLGVHLASYKSRATALAGWSELRAAAPSALSALEPRLETVDLGAKGVFMRLKAGPVASKAEGEAVCAALRADGRYCALESFVGERL